MLTVHTVAEMRRLALEARRTGQRTALVPTMGALHEGHLSLVEEARRHADHVTVSIFVNPTQFSPGEDFERYPRTLATDLEALSSIGGVDAVFAPTVEEMYPGGSDATSWVTVEGLDACLCGATRPGHFRGVTTVVAKLFNICLPDVAVFGLKDAQQFLILRRMVRDLSYGIEMIGAPTVREADGLARSSRNVYLSPEERRQAVVLSQAVAEARRGIEAGEQHPGAIVEAMRRVMETAPGARVQYAEVVDVETVQPVERILPGQEVLAAVAVFFGTTRLIDNAFITAPAARMASAL